MGDGTTTDSHAPKKIGIDTNWVSIAAGGDYSIALKSDGTLWAWGCNIDGQLGDCTGNSKHYPIQVFLDDSAPIGNIRINSSAAYTKNIFVTLSLSATDSCSLVTQIQMQFSNDNAIWSLPEAFSVTKNDWPLSTGDGIKIVYVKFQDNVGNWSDAFSDTIVLDTIRPTTTALPAGGGWTTSQSVTLTCNDGAVSGCDKTYYTTDGLTPTTSSPIYSGPITIATTTTLKFFARDKADNSEDPIKTEIYTINLPPVANDQSVITNEDTPVTITLIATDVDGNPLTYRIVSNPSHGALSNTPPNLTYTPSANYNGTDYFTFKANNGFSDSNTATVNITVNPVNDAPIAHNKAIVTNEDTPVTIILTATDVDGNPLTYRIVSNPSHGSLSGTPPNVTYTPSTNYSGTDSFTFKANDGASDSNTATVNITVNDTTLPSTAATPPGGTYLVRMWVTLKANENSTIYYTTDGTEPTANGSNPATRVYDYPILVFDNISLTLKFFAVDSAGNREATKTEGYTIKVMPEWTNQDGTLYRDAAYGVAVDESYSVYVAGLTDGNLDGSNTNYMHRDDVFMVKYSFNGDHRAWIKQTGSPDYDDAAFGVAVDIYGNVYVTGRLNGGLAETMFLAKYDPDGNELWKREYGTPGYDTAWGIAADGCGNVYVVGDTNDAFEGYTKNGDDYDLFLVKYDSQGNRLWTRQLGTSGDEHAKKVAVEGCSFVYVAGSTDGSFEGYDNEGSLDGVLVTYDSSGTLLWLRQIGTPDSAVGVNSVTVDGSGGDIYIAGYTDGALDGNTNAGGNDAFLMKFLPNGNRLWTTQFGTTSDDAAVDLVVDGTGNIYVAGNTGGSLEDIVNAGGTDFFLLKYDSIGNRLYTKFIDPINSVYSAQFGTSEEDFVAGMAIDRCSNIYLTGETSGGLDGNSNAGTAYNPDFFVMEIVTDDKTGVPIGSIKINNNAGYTNDTSVNLTITCEEGPECSEVMLSNDGLYWQGPIAFNTNQMILQWELAPGNGTKPVAVKFKDGVCKHWSDAYQDTIVLDTMAPTLPSNVKATPMSLSQIDLSWDASVDATSGVEKYIIYNANTGEELATTASTSHSFTGLTPNSPYRYYVKAKDLAGNFSQPSSTVSVTTYNDLEPTSTGQNVIVDFGNNVTVTFSEVTVSGTTSITVSSTEPSPAPSEFSILGYFFNIETSAKYNPPITVTLPYDESLVKPPTKEEDLRLLHLEKDNQGKWFWKDVTTSVNTSNNTITGSVNSLSFFAVGYVVSADVVTILPIGNDVVPSGAIYGMCWQAPLSAVKFDLQYTTNGTDWIPIMTLTGLNCVNWELPVVTANKKNCYAKVIAYDSNNAKIGEGISERFTIEVLRITSPNGGEVLRPGSTWNIGWKSFETIRPVAKTKLLYTTNRGTTYKLIKTLTGNPGATNALYRWTVPNVSSTKCKVKVVLKDANGVNVGADVSDKVFTIQP